MFRGACCLHLHGLYSPFYMSFSRVFTTMTVAGRINWDSHTTPRQTLRRTKPAVSVVTCLHSCLVGKFDMIIRFSLMTINTTKRDFCYATPDPTNGDSKLSETTVTIYEPMRNNKPKDGKLSTPLRDPGIVRLADSLASP